MKRLVQSAVPLLVACGLIAMSAVPSLAVVAPTPIKVSPNVDAYNPAASAAYFAWEQNSAGAPGHYDVMAQPRGGGAAWKVNAAGTEGCCSEPVLGTDTIVYQQYTNSQSDIFLYNMSTKKRVKFGSRVNTSAWEYWPTGSTKYVMFMRQTSTARVLLLWNRKTNGVQKLASVGRNCSGCLSPEWVGSTHAIYAVCGKNYGPCRLKIWTAGGGTMTLPEDTAPYSQYDAAMDETSGDVYYVYSTDSCGLFVELRRWNIAGGSATMIYDFPEGIDANSVSLAPSMTTPGDIDLLFSDWDCLYDDADIHQIESVNLP